MISEFEDFTVWTIQNEAYREKKSVNKKIGDFWDTIKWSLVHITGAQQEKTRRDREIFEEIIAKSSRFKEHFNPTDSRNSMYPE